MACIGGGGCAVACLGGGATPTGSCRDEDVSAAAAAAAAAAACLASWICAISWRACRGGGTPL